MLTTTTLSVYHSSNSVITIRGTEGPNTRGVGLGVGAVVTVAGATVVVEEGVSPSQVVITGAEEDE
jgi:hypothetical protein